MPTGEIAPQHALQMEVNQLKIRGVSPSMMSQFKPAVSEKINHYGIEVVDRLVWKGWEQGKEYIQQVVLKNFGITTQKIKYKVPLTKFFTTLYPKPIFLSAGASFTLPITFRPLENIEYTDRVLFILKDGNNFEVSLKALLPQMDISLPEHLDFNMCAVQDSIFIMFDVFNVGDVDTPLKWEVNEPFSIEPEEAELKRNGSVKFRASFQPTDAFVYEVIAFCRFGLELELAGQTTFYGIGKFPHLLVSHAGEKIQTEIRDNLVLTPETEVNFGKVPVSFTAEIFLELHNLSQVQTPFKVERIPGMKQMNTVFRCMQTWGIVPPMSVMKIPVSYSPHTVDLTSIDYFSVTSVGNVSHSIIKCIGTAIGPSVDLSTYCINFQQVDIGCTVVQTFDVINNSSVEAVYQFEVDCEESVFKFSIVSGFIKPMSRQTIVVQFVPQHPINYYRRVTFLVHNQLPQYLDLLGTSHSEVVKPAILKKHHLTRYNTHVERGLSLIAPEQLNELVQTGRLKVDENGCMMVVIAEDKANLIVSRNPQEIPAMEEYFNDGVHTDIINILPHVSLDVHILDFGNVQNLNIPQERTVNITNHTRGKVTVQWMGDSSHVFYINPTSLDIPPLKSCSFRVTFRAVTPNKMYGNELECYAFYKSLRDYRMVQDITQCPPWCLTVKCLGHTFMPNNDTFVPRAAIEPRLLVFPAVNAGENTYQTLLVGNDGDTPILYDLTPSFIDHKKIKPKCGTTPQQQNFFVKPNKGILRSGYQVFSVQLTATEVNKFSHDLLLRLNDNEKYDQVVHLCGSAESPNVMLDGDGNMYFKPTCAGTSSTRSYSFKNISRIALRFQWKLSKDNAKCLSVEPSYGTVQPNESVRQTWTFTPVEEKKYVLKATLVASGQGLSALSSGGKKQYFSLRVIGQGCYGDVQADQTHLDFGDILVGSSASRSINIYNNSICSLQYELIVDGASDGDVQQSTKKTAMLADKARVEFDSMKGELSARGKHSIMATVRPAKCKKYQFAVSYQLITPYSQEKHPAVLEPQHLIHLLATGVYPSMTVKDIRAQGSLIGTSKQTLWKLFSLNELNECLDSDPSSIDLMHTTLVHNRTMLDFNFSAGPLGSEQCTITIIFKNSRTVLCDWAFIFPKDVQVEMEYWAESGECGQDELHEMKIMDNNLFDVNPTKGSLKSGETVSVTLTYQHAMIGTHTLPVLLKIAKGREILLNFVGVTVSHNSHYIHFPTNKHLFHPMAIGVKVSPKQNYELYNGGAVPVSFEADLTPLSIIKKENFDHTIFECLTPKGNILPGQTMIMEWRFSPLEAKTYMVDVPIKVQDGDVAFITFTGVGFDPRVLGDSMLLTDGHEACRAPSIQIADVPGQLGFLSMERISFGNLPLSSQVRRMVFVTNMSKDRSIFFEWHVTSTRDSQFINVYPVREKIGPRDCKMCRVTFLATGVPAFYNIDLVCEISDLHEYTNYKRELAAWQIECDRQVNEFTITENDLHADMRTPNVVNYVSGPSSGRLSKLEALAEGRSPSTTIEISKYKTLPPIRKLTVDEQRELLRKQQIKLSQLWQKPQPQKPFLLHLGITARTHDHRVFQANFPDELNYFFIDRTLNKTMTLPEPYQQQAEAPSFIECSLVESSIVASVFGNCLRSLLDDTFFIQAVTKVMQEPIPYFRQFADVQPDAVTGTTIATVGHESQDSLKNEEESASGSYEADNAVSLSALSDIAMTVQHADGSLLTEMQDTISGSGRRSMMDHYPQRISELNRLEMEAQLHKQIQSMKRLPEFGHAVEQVLENTVLNLMNEAMFSEYSIISKPKLIAMAQRKLSETISSNQ